jgi:hypothetical protein
MGQRGNGTRFALESLLSSRIVGKMRGQNLNSYGALQPRVAGTVHFSHATLPQQ